MCIAFALERYSVSICVGICLKVLICLLLLDMHLSLCVFVPVVDVTYLNCGGAVRIPVGRDGWGHVW